MMLFESLFVFSLVLNAWAQGGPIVNLGYASYQGDMNVSWCV